MCPHGNNLKGGGVDGRDDGGWEAVACGRNFETLHAMIITSVGVSSGACIPSPQPGRCRGPRPLLAILCRRSGRRSAFCWAWDGASSSGTPARRCYRRRPLWGRLSWRGRGSNRNWTPPEAPNLDDPPTLLEPAFVLNLAPRASDDPTFNPTFDPPPMTMTFDRTFDPASERRARARGRPGRTVR